MERETITSWALALPDRRGFASDSGIVATVFHARLFQSKERAAEWRDTRVFHKDNPARLAKQATWKTLEPVLVTLTAEFE